MPSSTSSKKTTTPAPAPPTATPIPTPEDPGSKYAPDAWLNGGVGGREDLTVPSGQVCLVSRPGLEGLIRAGVLRNVDSLSAIVSSKHIKKSKKGAPDKVNAESILKDPEALESIMHTVDKVVCHCVIMPQIVMSPNDITLRKPGIVYADMIGLEDKMFIFNFVVGGTRDLESFRGGLDGAVGGLEAESGVPDPTE